MIPTPIQTFCNTAKLLDAQLKRTGAVEFYAKGSEETIELWIENLWNRLDKEVIRKAVNDDSGESKEEKGKKTETVID